MKVKKLEIENLEMSKLRMQINHYDQLSKFLIILSGIAIAIIAIISIIYTINF